MAAMAPVTVVSSILLIILGGWAYLTGTPKPPEEHVSFTALIPAFVGLPLLLLGLLAFKDSWRKHAMHAAAALGLLGFLGGAVNLVRLLLNLEITNALNFDPASDGWPAAKKVLVSGIMALICVVFVALCVRSFVAARMARKSQPGTQG